MGTTFVYNTFIICVIVNYVEAVPLIPIQNEGYPQGRLSLLDWQSYSHTEPEGPGTYAFGYDIEEPQNDNIQFRNEERHSNGTVTGSYGFVTPDGNVHIINYIADNLGYRASTETRYRGSGKPVKVNEEQDIKDALAAVNYAKAAYTEGIYSNNNQDAAYLTPTNKFNNGNLNLNRNYKYRPDSSRNQENNAIFKQGNRNDQRVYYPNPLI